MKFENYHVFRTAVGGKLLELEIGKSHSELKAYG